MKRLHKAYCCIQLVGNKIYVYYERFIGIAKVNSVYMQWHTNFTYLPIYRRCFKYYVQRKLIIRDATIRKGYFVLVILSAFNGRFECLSFIRCSFCIMTKLLLFIFYFSEMPIYKPELIPDLSSRKHISKTIFFVIN